jgi:hypothetical protein
MTDQTLPYHLGHVAVYVSFNNDFPPRANSRKDVALLRAANRALVRKAAGAADEVTKDKDSGIENDPNAWSDDPRYIIDLIKRVTQVSIKSAALVASLPALNESASSKAILKVERDVECVLK